MISIVEWVLEVLSTRSGVSSVIVVSGSVTGFGARTRVGHAQNISRN